ncbi:MAG: site-2 protease family protein [Rhodospirillales bacterium]|nr:site-2 protease family protein [Rhodospirillales bacterium]MDE2197380.1 site-2 protease family protein [Rhodospirillales bacterium]
MFPALSPGLAAASYWTMGIAATGGLLLSIVFHETAHALVARHYGIPMRGITLFIFGGVAEMAAEPRRPRDELLMAAAGPAASLALAVLLDGLSAAALAAGAPAAIAGVAGYLALLNGMLGIFNLIPAFPLDGGRILRAALWAWRGDLEWATRLAAGAGTAFGTLLIVLGLIGVLEGDFIGGLWRFLIGLFVNAAASASYGETVARRLLAAIPVSRVMNPDPITVSPQLSVQAFFDDYVYRYHHRWFPVMDGPTVLGSVATQQAVALERSLWPGVPVGEVMRPLTAEDVIEPETDAYTALQKMRGGGAGRLVVLRDGVLLGIVSSRDLLGVLALEQVLHDRMPRDRGRVVPR